MGLNNTKHGVFKPRHPEKYVGTTFPIYRSSWELKAFFALDRNEKILRWGSETYVIAYNDCTRNNELHKYVIDLFFEIADYTKNGLPIKWLLEIKPESQAVFKPVSKRKSAAAALSEAIIVSRNKCKWEAAVSFCKSKGWHFGVYTENGITKLC